MINTQKIGVLVLSLVFLLCIPIHILSVSQHMSHMHHAEEHVAADMFTHLGEMTHAPWIFSFIIIAGALLYWFRIAYTDACLKYVVTRSAHTQTFVDTGGISYWLTLHHTSPPSLA